MSLLALILFYFQQEVEEEFPTKSDEATPPPASEEAHPPPPAAWRYLSCPSDHVMLLGCSGDEFTVRIMPCLEGLEQQSLREANGDLRPDCCLRPATGTLSVYNCEPHYDAVFWAFPGQEKCVPVPVPSRESEAAMVVVENPSPSFSPPTLWPSTGRLLGGRRCTSCRGTRWGSCRCPMWRKKARPCDLFTPTASSTQISNERAV